MLSAFYGGSRISPCFRESRFSLFFLIFFFLFLSTPNVYRTVYREEGARAVRVEEKKKKFPSPLRENTGLTEQVFLLGRTAALPSSLPDSHYNQSIESKDIDRIFIF